MHVPTCAQISLNTFIHYQFVRFFLNKKRILSFTSTRKLQIPPIVGMTINMSFRGTRNLAFLILNTHNFLSFLESRFLQIPPIVGMTFILSFRLQGEIFPLLPATFYLLIILFPFLIIFFSLFIKSKRPLLSKVLS